MRKFTTILIVLLASNGLAQVLPGGFVAEPAFSGEPFDLPTGMSFAPDGTLFVIEKRGRVYIVADSIRQEPPFLDLEQEVGSA